MTIQNNRGNIKAAELRRDFAKIQRATKMQILFLILFATATQRNDLAVLSDSFDRHPTTLIREVQSEV